MTPIPLSEWHPVQRPAIEVGLVLALIYPDRVTWCARCERLPAKDVCWYCDGELCIPCWEALGHCGHPEAAAINEASRRATPGQRARMINAVAREQGGEVIALAPEDEDGAEGRPS